MTKPMVVVAVVVIALATGACGEPGVSLAADGTPMKLVLDLGNDVTLNLARIPSGTFLMGSPEGEKDRSENEGPQHEVTMSKAFYMGIYEVTQQQYTRIMGNNPSYDQKRRNPVERVTWNEAVEFCRKLSQQTGRTVRLPTEAEWEYACRAGTKTRFNCGDTIDRNRANCWGRWGILTERAKTVGSYKPNEWGLCDMHGNVWEWCADAFDQGYYTKGERTDPQGPLTETHRYRVLRGGMFGSDPQDCRSARRDWNDPTYRLTSIGFRVVVELN